MELLNFVYELGLITTEYFNTLRIWFIASHFLPIGICLTLLPTAIISICSICVYDDWSEFKEESKMYWPLIIMTILTLIIILATVITQLDVYSTTGKLKAIIFENCNLETIALLNL